MNNLEPGSVVAGKYELERELGRGGFGTVWRAQHLDLGDPVAIKILDPDLARDAEIQRRFLREFRATTSFVHEYAVQLRDFGRDSDNDLLYFTMDLIEGSTLQDLFSEGRLDPARAVAVGAQVLEVLEKAHEAGFAHRDLKPSNLILTRNRKGDEEIRVLDFGIAKALASSSELTQLTRSKAVIGTVAYMSPEQAQGASVNHLTDLYSLGVVLYEALAGRLPITPEEGAENPRLNLHHRIIHVEPEPLEGVGAELAGVIMRALSKDPQRRYPSAGDMRAALLATAAPEGLPVSRTAGTELLTQASDRPSGETASRPQDGSTQPGAPEVERFAPAELYCMACGAGNREGQRKNRCRTCKAPLAGTAYDEAFAAPLSAASFLKAPDRCVCCLQPAEKVDEHPVHGGSSGARIDAPIPWCQDCYDTNAEGLWKPLAGIALGVLVGGLIAYWTRQLGFQEALLMGGAGGVLVAVVCTVVLVTTEARSDRSGHTAGCNAVLAAGLYEMTSRIGSVVGPPTLLVKLQFANKAFAELYREVNGTA